MLNLLVFPNYPKHCTAWDRHITRKIFVSALSGINFLLYCHKELTPIKTTEFIQDILKASDPSNTNRLCL